jgi:hypothetical protein
MPNFTGVSARPFFSTGLPALKRAMAARRAGSRCWPPARRPAARGGCCRPPLAVGRDVAVAGAVEVGAAHRQRVAAQAARHRCRSGCSMAIAPCGPPKPRKAVLLCVLVRRRVAVQRPRAAASRRCRSGTARASSPGPTGRPNGRRWRPSSTSARQDAARRRRGRPLQSKWKPWRRPVIRKSSSRSSRSLTGRCSRAPPPRPRRRTAPTAIPCRRSRRPCAGTRPAPRAPAGPARAPPRAASRWGAG